MTVDCDSTLVVDLNFTVAAVDRPREDDVREISQILPEVLARYGLGFDGSLALVGVTNGA